MSIRSNLGQLYRLLYYPRQAMLRRSLRDPQASQCFKRMRREYSNIYQRLIDDWKPPSANGKPHFYDWSSWSATVYKSFARGVPHRFLTHPIVAKTMVFGSNGAAKAPAS